MRSKSFIGVAAALVILAVLAGGVYAYDQSQSDKIAKGVTVGGVDIGGMSKSAAEGKLRRALLPGLRQPIRVRHSRDHFRLSARQAGIKVDIAATVDEALQRSRDGNLFTRAFRTATGGSVDESITPKVSYNDRAIVRLIDQVRDRVDRDPVDAKLDFTPGAFQKVDGRDGLRINTTLLHEQIAKAITDPQAKHHFVALTQHLKPEVTTDELAKKYATLLVVDREHFQLVLYKRLRLVKKYNIAVGMAGLETPAGMYHIQNKAVNPAWTMPNSSWVAPADRGKVVPGGTAANPLKARWLGIFDGAGIHGIDPSEYSSIGHAASHGCVRMTIPDVIDLYDRVPVGAPIYIS